MARRTNIRGEAELLRQFQRQANAVTGQTIDAIALEALRPLEERTRANARKRRRNLPKAPRGGHLDEGIVTRKVSSHGRFKREFWTGLTRRARRIGHLVEYGTAPHWQPRRGRMHPGARPFPFFRPAFESTKDVVTGHFIVAMWRVIRLSIRS